MCKSVSVSGKKATVYTCANPPSLCAMHIFKAQHHFLDVIEKVSNPALGESEYFNNLFNPYQIGISEHSDNVN